MQFEESKQEFVKKWGDLAVNWGTNRIMGQIHGLLLISNKPLCTDSVMSFLDISRGSTNTNLRNLVDWGLAFKEASENRKEFFTAEKSIWKIFCQIVKHRKKKELDPMTEILDKMICLDCNCDDSKEFVKVVKDLQHFSQKAEKALDNIIKEEPSFLVSTYLKMLN